MNHAGMDVAGFPGLETMRWLKANTNLEWTGFYLTPAPSLRGNMGWMPQYQALREQGWGILPIYSGQQSRGPGSKHPSKAHGERDGNDAVTLAGRAGLPKPSVLYLDMEDGSLTALMKVYAETWVAAVAAQGYTPGIYCSYRFAGQLTSLQPRPKLFVFKIRSNPAGKDGYATPDPSKAQKDAESWQYAQNLSIPAGEKKKLKVDLDSSVSANPADPTTFPQTQYN